MSRQDRLIRRHAEADRQAAEIIRREVEAMHARIAAREQDQDGVDQSEQGLTRRQSHG